MVKSVIGEILAKRVRKVGDLGLSVLPHNDRDNIEAVVHARLFVFAQVVPGCFPEVALLALPHAVFGIRGIGAKAGLHFHEGDLVAAPHQQVDLIAATHEISGQNPVAAKEEVASGESFSPRAK